MNVSGPIASNESRASRPVFVSYATADRKEALSVTKAIERRGTKCWISTRDVAPGENYQEEIVRVIRDSRAMVLVFSDAANNSDEIKKELSLASRYHVPVMALRIEDVEPSDAFAYELSTRQWIDAFAGWDHSIDALVTKLEQSSRGHTPVPVGEAKATTQHRRTSIGSWPHRWAAAGAAGLALLVVLGVFVWRQFAVVQPLTVQIGKIQALSGAPADAPAAFQQALADTIGDENAVQIRGKDATYTLTGAINNLGDKLDYAVRLTDTRSGDMMWSADRAFDTAAGAAGPQQAAASVSWVIRCGLADAMESKKPLPARALSLYLQYCQLANWGGSPTRALDLAKQVVQLAPDFSKGWSRVASAAGEVALRAPDDQKASLIATGSDAVRRALALDPRNGIAYDAAAMLVPPTDWSRREMLHKRAVEVRESNCGCEHEDYASFLLDVGRPTEAVAQAQRAVDMQPSSPSALDVLAAANYAKGAIAAGDKVVEDRTSFWKASPGSKNSLLWQAMETKRWDQVATSAKQLLTEPTEKPLAEAFAALASRDPARIAAARAAVVAMHAQDDSVRVAFLAAIGDTKDALAILKRTNARQIPAAFFLLDPQVAPLRSDPGFVELLKERGLIDYWRKSKKPPEFCKSADAPPLCRMI